MALPADLLPVELPDITDFEPATSDDPDALPEPPLARAPDWVEVELDLDGPVWAGHGRGRQVYLRETNTMPQWAGSCWYYLRYLDPTNEDAMVDPVVEQAWAAGTRADGSPKTGLVDIYVGGVEHGVLHLLYARFWHKVLYDLGYVSTPEPFQRLLNQGYVLAAAYTDERGMHVEATDVVERDGAFFLGDAPVSRELGKMGKSLKNAVAPDDIFHDYGADTLRLYEMFMGPIETSRPWNTADIIGVYRFLQRLWRNVIDEDTGATRVDDEPADDATRRKLHETIEAVRNDMSTLAFNTAIARLFELNNHLTQVVQEQGACTARSRHAAGADGRPARAARRRGAVGATRAHGHARLRALPDRRPRAAGVRSGRGAGADRRQGAQPHHGAGGGRRRDARSPGPSRHPHRRVARRYERAQGDRRTRPARQLRRLSRRG